MEAILSLDVGSRVVGVELKEWRREGGGAGWVVVVLPYHIYAKDATVFFDELAADEGIKKGDKVSLVRVADGVLGMRKVDPAAAGSLGEV